MSHDLTEEAILDDAYAVLGLTPGTPAPDIKQRYRELVKKWHPDQFVGDPQGVAEATTMLKVINRAYSTILQHRNPRALKSRANVAAAATSNYASIPHLTPAQIDEIVDAINHSHSLLHVAFEDSVSGWKSRVASGALVVAYMIAARPANPVEILLSMTLPLLCIWFPDMLGAKVGGRITKPSPPSFVWFFGWIVLLVPLFAVLIIRSMR